MTEQESQDGRSSKTSITLHSSSSKSDIDVRREKKKKLVAFQTFLDNKISPPPLQELPRRQLSGSQTHEEHLESANKCRICKEYLTHQAKLCQFCGETLCLGHFRKRRRNGNTNKWARICEHCEDKYLMEKHYRDEMKTEESLLTQQIILEDKIKQAKQLLNTKQAALQILINKRTELARLHNQQLAKIEALNKELQKKEKALESGFRDNSNLQFSLMSLQKKLPPSLQADFQYFESDNARITKDLIRYQKLCIDAVKARSQREKEMYREYYQWEQQKRRELEAADKEEECCIY